MNLFLSIWSLTGIGICVFVMRSFVTKYQAKGCVFSPRTLVARAYVYAALVIGSAVDVIAYLCCTFDFKHSPRTDVSLADLSLFYLFVWNVCAWVFACLLLSRAIDRSMEIRRPTDAATDRRNNG